jgi:hypothetical protein
VFSLSDSAIKTLFPRHLIPGLPKHLAYVEWFTAFTPSPEPHHKLYKISRLLRNGDRLASVIPVLNIKQSLHLFPRFGHNPFHEWSSSDVLEKCPVFFVNPFTDRYGYCHIY